MYSSLRFLYSLTNATRKGLLSVAHWPWVSRHPQGLLNLPTEILELIAKELEWDDVLRLRITSKLLRNLTYSKDIWTELFQRYLQGSMPNPFILPKPLSECSSAEVERIVWTSQAGLNLPRSFMAGQPHSLAIPNTSAKKIEITPGGRWLLIGCCDGSVWSYDLDASSNEARAPIRLLEPPVPAGTYPCVASIQFSIDCTSEQVNSNNGESFKSLDHFNLVVAVTYLADDPFLSLQVWRVRVQNGAGNLPTRLQAYQRLSSFSEDGDDSIHSISLHGPHVAYSRRKTARVIIVDWRLVDGKQVGVDSDFMRWFLRSWRHAGRGTPRVFLLPGELLLLISAQNACVGLWNWRQSSMYTDLVSSHLWNQDLADGEPVSHYDLPSCPTEVYDILPPIKVNGHFECAIPTDNHGLFLVSIPDQRHDSPPDLTCSHVYVNRLDSHKRFCSLFGFRYSLTFRAPMSSPGWTFIPYGNSVTPERLILSTSSKDKVVLDHAHKIHAANQVTVDQYLHRIVASNLKTFLFIDLTPSFPQPPSKS